MVLHQAGSPFADQRIEVDTVDQVQRIEHVALRLGHLLAVRIADEPMYVNLAKRYFVHEFETHHDHARDPEKDDIETRHQDLARIKGS